MASSTHHLSPITHHPSPITSYTSPTAQNWLLSVNQLWRLMLLTLHLAASKLPEKTSWSLWPYTFIMPPWLGWALALLAGALIIPIVSQTVIKGLRFTLQCAASPWDVSRFAPP